jgi:hypothetical protein
MCFKCYTDFRERLSKNEAYKNHEDALKIMNIEESTELNITTDVKGNHKMASNLCNPQCVCSDSIEHDILRATFFLS